MALADLVTWTSGRESGRRILAQSEDVPYYAVMNDVAGARPAQLTLELLGSLRLVEEHLEAALEPLGLSLAKLKVLAELVAAGEPLPLRTLAERCACVRSNITQLVDRLEADGLVVARTTRTIGARCAPS